MIIETKRLYLRPIAQTDLESIWAIYGDPQTHLFNPAGPYPDIAYTQAKLTNWLAEWSRNGFGNWAISLRSAPAKVIGCGGLSRRQIDETRNINLGYRFSTAVWGQGLATELALAALDYGFEQLKLPEISATVRENHLASRRVLEKVGMHQVSSLAEEGHKIGSAVYTIVAEKHRAMR
jgi:RimJ/RimL family protein N-acetyltransferase